MLRVFRLRPVQRWPEDWMRDVQVIFSQVLRWSTRVVRWAHGVMEQETLGAWVRSWWWNTAFFLDRQAF
jgi:hypothetical protein